MVATEKAYCEYKPIPFCPENTRHWLQHLPRDNLQFVVLTLYPKIAMKYLALLLFLHGSSILIVSGNK